MFTIKTILTSGVSLVSASLVDSHSPNSLHRGLRNMVAEVPHVRYKDLLLMEDIQIIMICIS